MILIPSAHYTILTVFVRPMSVPSDVDRVARTKVCVCPTPAMRARRGGRVGLLLIKNQSLRASAVN